MRFAHVLGIAVSIASVAGGGEPFRGLGIYSSQYPHSVSTGVSSDGMVVVGTMSSASSQINAVGFRWTEATGVQPLPIPNGDTYARPIGVTGDGTTIAGNSFPAEGFSPSGFHYRDEVFIPLPLLPGYPESYVAAISRTGDATLGRAQGAVPSPRHVIWDRDLAIIEIGLPSGSHSPTSISSTSPPVVVGYSSVAVSAFRWSQDSGFEPLPDLPSGPFGTIATAISSDAHVIVGRGTSSVAHEAVRWVDGVISSLGRLTNETESEALAVSAGGSLIVGHAKISGNWRAFIWTAAGGKRLLSDVLTIDYGVDLSGWTLLSASAVSDDGRYIVGHGTTPFGTEAFLITLAPFCPPLQSDINADGRVDIQDLALMLGDFGLRCP